MKKKIISFALTVAMVFGMASGFAIPVFADSDLGGAALLTAPLIAPAPGDLLIAPLIAPNPADLDIMPVIAPNPMTSYDVCEKGETCPLAAFTDLDSAMWYHDGIHYAIDNGLMDGMGNGIFLPKGNATKAQVITILWRIAGEPYVNYIMPFEDVDADLNNAWYIEAVRWAASEKIIEVGEDNKFNPKEVVTREQFASLMFKFAKQQGIDTTLLTEEVNTLSFDDIFTVSEDAKEGMHFCLASGIIEGDEGNVMPRQAATRAQLATMLMRYCENVAKFANIN